MTTTKPSLHFAAPFHDFDSTVVPPHTSKFITSMREFLLTRTNKAHFPDAKSALDSTKSRNFTLFKIWHPKPRVFSSLAPEKITIPPLINNKL